MHETGLERHKCSRLIESDHENRILTVIPVSNDDKMVNGYVISRKEIMQIMSGMRSRNAYKTWVAFVHSKSVSLLECTFDDNVWKSIWRQVKKYLDKDKPSMPDKLTDLKIALNKLLDDYVQNNVKLLGEQPRVKGIWIDLPEPKKNTAYYTPEAHSRIAANFALEDKFQELAIRMSDVITEGFNFLRVEASEIIAFVATDCDRVVKPGIPPHLPIAYGLRGSSMPMSIMRNMINDIRDELKKNNSHVLCEVYDGQFHPIIVKSENGCALTRIQQAQKYYRDTMMNNTKDELLNKLLLYSSIVDSDNEKLSETVLIGNTTLELTSISIEKKVELGADNTVNKIYVWTNKIGNVGMEEIKTCHREYIWNRYVKFYDNMRRKESMSGNILSKKDICDLIRGTKLHRRITQHHAIDDCESEISDEEEDDPDFIPHENQPEFTESDSEESIDNDVETESQLNLSNVSIGSTGSSCIKKILIEMKKINNKHNWILETIDTFIVKYFRSRSALGKLFMYEMDIINSAVHDFFGIHLFQKKDNKTLRVNKMYAQLKQMPQLLSYESSSDEAENVFQPKSLFNIYKDFILSSKYPKDYIAAPICCIGHVENVREWESKSPVPIHLELPNSEEKHIVFNYPEYHAGRKQIELRTFDYTHILNNLRYHVSNNAINGISSAAFIAVSDVNDEILPRAIVEDKLDRQNCTISRRFFSADVQKILHDIGHNSEAEFTERVRNWFNACDERGMDVHRRLKFLQEMYNYMLRKVDFSKYPPIHSEVHGIPIKTFEALLHCISSRFTLFVLSSTKSYNTRAVSTLAVESFFSDLNRFEFSGLGAPKAVDIPKLISHIVYINSVKHDPNRGFEFSTSTRDNYPTYFMETEPLNRNLLCYKNHPFDRSRTHRKKQSKKFFHLAKPKGITKGGRGIRQYISVDESKLTMEQRLGKKITVQDCQM